MSRAEARAISRRGMHQIRIADPTWTRTEESWSDRLALHVINDVRDVPFLKLLLTLTFVVAASGIAMFVHGFRWWHAAAHVVLVLWFLGPYILMLHNTSHRKFFNKKWARLN